MAAGQYDIYIEQGATFTREIEWLQSDNTTPVDLTGYTARMQVRKTAKSPIVVADLSTGNGRISLTPALGKIKLMLTATETASLKDGEYVYDLELQSGTGVVERLLQGTFTINAEVTR
ncbi:hypothetical protein Sp245p_28965 (plasmid) [Azospirillum baldaniorum]|uniref:Uncharacterized protein n=1 Tax=Azospirillum baldaniorum TaxID=1064539 RepID=A0A9P1NQH8_9PROT|nr:hypothetical protein [Azospirillum baldaniorum]AWJ93853.1 hypothetical protein Sp245p_28965 [Azospirillum baldaniorum]TWA81678.1 hypothetical protein FBZ85_10252 [Azospirillum brasilense]CCD02014.1 conserved protein of unknown function [Azospirillum baldaniorum]